MWGPLQSRVLREYPRPLITLPTRTPHPPVRSSPVRQPSTKVDSSTVLNPTSTSVTRSRFLSLPPLHWSLHTYRHCFSLSHPYLPTTRGLSLSQKYSPIPSTITPCPYTPTRERTFPASPSPRESTPTLPSPTTAVRHVWRSHPEE